MGQRDADGAVNVSLYLAYHDEEWGVPVHDDQRLFKFLESGVGVVNDHNGLLSP
jgi:DNA-3-methyladenine glycosylase I